MRLEAVGPLGRRMFTLASRDGSATLLLESDRRVLRNAPPQDILGALTGVTFAPADVQAILTGTVEQRGDEVVLGVELVDARDRTRLWGENYRRTVDDLQFVQLEIAQQIANSLRLQLTGNEQARLAKRDSGNAEAYQLYMKGRYFWNKRTAETIAKAIEYFDAAIAKDPNFALAYAGLADAYVVPANRMAPKEAMPKAKAAATRALEIDDALAEAHTSLGRVLQVYEWNWKEAEKEFKRAIELNPRYPVAHQWYGGYWERRGRLTEAVAERKIAIGLDPLSTIANFELGQSYYFAGDYDKALEQFNRALELDPSFPPAVQYVPLVYCQKGMYEEAIASAEQMLEGTSIGNGVRGYVLAVGGRERVRRRGPVDFRCDGARVAGV